MTTYRPELEIDFGDVGYRNARQPFRVRLDVAALTDLIAHAGNAHRVYELMMIDRPGDVWEYVSVAIDDASSRVAQRVASARKEATPRSGGEHPWPDRRIPFPAFDRLFHWSWDDTEPEDEAWLSQRASATMQTFARQLSAIVRAAQSGLAGNDHLLRHLAVSVRSEEHPYSFLGRGVAVEQGRENSPKTPSHTPGFYKQLDALLGDPELTSIAYRADGDYRVLRMMATEQRRRADRTGHSVGHAMHESALVNRKINNEAWGSEIWFFEEGLGYGDLVIQGPGLGEKSVKGLVELHGRVPGRYILCAQDEGDIKGFHAEVGDGWVLYRKQKPDPRRVGLERIAERRHSKLGPVLKFEGLGTTLFEYDKAVVVVGDDVDASARTILAASMAEWQQYDGDPVIVVTGESRPFDLAGCRYLFAPAEQSNAGDQEALQAWFWQTLQRVRPWMDVIIALSAPPWATQVLADRSKHAEGLWAPWVIATSGVQHLHADVTISGDLSRVLDEAHERARSARPQIL